MIRLFSALGAMAILGSSVVIAPQTLAEEECHPAYRDVCVPVNLRGAKKIHVEKGTRTKPLCIKLGSWTGENPVVIEWNGRYAAKAIKAKGYSNAVMVRVRHGKKPGYLRVYSPRSYHNDMSWEWSNCNTGMANNISTMKWVR